MLLNKDHNQIIPANFFSVKCMRFFVSIKTEFFKIYRRLLKIVEDFQKTSKDRRRFPTTSKDFRKTSNDNQRCRNIFDDFKIGPAKISKEFPTDLEHY